jgi:hypothetical protein
MPGDLVNEDPFANYRDWVRRASSPDRHVRESLEAIDDECFESWLAVSDSATEGSNDSIGTIIAVASLAKTPEEFAYVCADLVESYEAGGGDLRRLRARVANELPEFLDAIDQYFG